MVIFGIVIIAILRILFNDKNLINKIPILGLSNRKFLWNL